MSHPIPSTLILALVATGAALFPDRVAAADIIPVSQERYVFQSVDEEFFIIHAPDFSPFDASLSAATQSSSIFADEFFGEGAVGPDPFFGINSATSYFRFVFDLAEATPFAFSGSMSTGLFGSAAAHLSGPAPGNSIVNLTIDEFETESWNEAGVLAAGQYTLEVFASNSIGGDLSTFQFAFAIPAPGALAAFGLLAVAPRRRRVC